MNYINISDLPSFVLLYTACSSSVNKMYIPQGVYETLRFCGGITYGVCKSDSEFDWLISNLRCKVWHFASANPPPTQTFLGVRHAVLPQVNEREGIWLVELYERIGKSIVLVGRKTQTDAVYACEKVEKTFWFCDLFIFLRQCIYSG